MQYAVSCGAAMTAQAVYDALDVYGCRIINISFGTAADSKTLRDAVDYVASRGALVVASAGNTGRTAPTRCTTRAGTRACCASARAMPTAASRTSRSAAKRSTCSRVLDPQRTLAVCTAAFSDVRAGAWYAEAVRWAVGAGVTNGVGEGRFAPDETCTRTQIATFLWRSCNG